MSIYTVVNQPSLRNNNHNAAGFQSANRKTPIKTINPNPSIQKFRTPNKIIQQSAKIQRHEPPLQKGTVDPDRRRRPAPSRGPSMVGPKKTETQRGLAIELYNPHHRHHSSPSPSPSPPFIAIAVAVTCKRASYHRVTPPIGSPLIVDC
jgi:hypothetical protein